MKNLSSIFPLNCWTGLRETGSTVRSDVTKKFTWVWGLCFLWLLAEAPRCHYQALPKSAIFSHEIWLTLSLETRDSQQCLLFCRTEQCQGFLQWRLVQPLLRTLRFLAFRVQSSNTPNTEQSRRQNPEQFSNHQSTTRLLYLLCRLLLPITYPPKTESTWETPKPNFH